ncbi:MAG: MoxR family ATPase [Candidatus Methanosuratincola petrocarbonis]
MGIKITLEPIEMIQRDLNIIDRSEELKEALLAITAKRHILIEGPVGVGKTVLAEALARFFKRKIYRVDGDERYTEHKLTGWFDPPLVMSKGYTREAFIEGPLTQAMLDGAFLFINELNRMPEGTQNVLLPAMDERKIVIPRIGTVEAKEGFLIIATQNPEEYIGTSRLSEALKDRFVLIKLDYQSEEDEQAIVKKETGSTDDELVKLAVRITRRTRECAEIRRGASVRGAIDLVAIAERMLTKNIAELQASERREVIERAAIMALSSKIEIREGSYRKLVEILKKIINDLLCEQTIFKSDKAEETLDRSKNF